MEENIFRPLFATEESPLVNIWVVQNGKIKDPQIIELRAEYLKRFQRYGKLTVQEVSSKSGKSLWPSQARWRVLLDERGKSMTSEVFARNIEQWLVQHGPIAFAVGESYGHDEQTRTEANFSIRLSDMVLPHQLAHLLLIEQLYRAASILNNDPYHHA